MDFRVYSCDGCSFGVLLDLGFKLRFQYHLVKPSFTFVVTSVFALLEAKETYFCMLTSGFKEMFEEID